MRSLKKSTKEILSRGRDAAVRVGKVVKSAVIVGAKAGAATALAAATLEAEKKWKETSPASARKRVRNGVAAMVAGAAVLGASVAIANSRRRK